MGNICKICSWKCKQDVKECPFFTENKNIPVLGRVTREGFFHNLGEDIRPASSDCFVIGMSQHSVEHVRMELTEGQRRVREAAIGNARRHIEEGSISVPRNISIEIRDEQEPLNTGYNDNDIEVYDSE